LDILAAGKLAKEGLYKTNKTVPAQPHVKAERLHVALELPRISNQGKQK